MIFYIFFICNVKNILKNITASYMCKRCIIIISKMQSMTNDTWYDIVSILWDSFNKIMWFLNLLYMSASYLTLNFWLEDIDYSTHCLLPLFWYGCHWSAMVREIHLDKGWYILWLQSNHCPHIKSNDEDLLKIHREWTRCLLKTAVQ